MGQYYQAVILDENGNIKIFMNPHQYNNGAKLMEHSNKENNFVKFFENLLVPNGIFYKSRVVWAGDYGPIDNDVGNNLHDRCYLYPNKELIIKSINNSNKNYDYLVNHTKKEYVIKTKQLTYHPLPFLTAEGNGLGGGDFNGIGKELVGIWARDLISLEENIPNGYTELECNFI